MVSLPSSNILDWSFHISTTTIAVSQTPRTPSESCNMDFENSSMFADENHPYLMRNWRTAVVRSVWNVCSTHSESPTTVLVRTIQHRLPAFRLPSAETEKNFWARIIALDWNSVFGLSLSSPPPLTFLRLHENLSEW